VDFEFVAQEDEGVMYGWNLFSDHVGWICILVVKRVVVSYMIRGASPFDAIVKYIFFSKEFKGYSPA